MPNAAGLFDSKIAQVVGREIEFSRLPFNSATRCANPGACKQRSVLQGL
jgi:hypothetical protein